MEILQPYNNDTLQLISDNSDYTFTAVDLQDGVIKISVFGDDGFFDSSGDLQENIDFYVKDDELFLKPNEYLDRNNFIEDNYNVQFDFLKRFPQASLFHISQVSPSRKEVRITAETFEISNELRDSISNFMNEDPNEEEEKPYQFNSYLEISQGRLIPINGYAFDEVTGNKRTLILKLNQPLPTDIETLSTDFNISNKFLSSQTETIFFIDREQLSVVGLGLDIDTSFATMDVPSSDSFANYNEITASVEKIL